MASKGWPAWTIFAFLCILFWGMWGFLAKIGSDTATPFQLQTLFTFGMVPVGLGMLVAMRWKLDRHPRGAIFGILSGVTTGLGILGYYGALRTQAASVVTPVTGIFPLFTVVLAYTLLRERLNRVQFCGIALALVAIVIFSL